MHSAGLRRALFSPSAVVLLASLLMVIYVWFTAGDVLNFAYIGRIFGGDASQYGYDGQFAYQIAVSPCCASPLLDAPAYRYQRILYPLLARLLALGQRSIIPYTLVLINILALVGGTFCVGRLLELYGQNRWYALVYGLYPGVLAGVRYDLTEPLSYGLLALAIWQWERGQRLLPALYFGLAAFAKETALVFVAAYLAATLLRRQWKAAGGLLALCVVPFALWQFALYLWLGQVGVSSGGENATPFPLIPFGGFLATAEHDAGWLLLWVALQGPTIVAPTLLVLARASRDLLRGGPHAATLAALLNAGVMVYLPFSTYADLLATQRLNVSLVLAALAFGASRRQPRFLPLLALLWLLTIVINIGTAGAFGHGPLDWCPVP